MKGLLLRIAVSLALWSQSTCAASADSGQAYLFDSSGQTPKAMGTFTLNPQSSFLVFVQRLGLDSFYRLGDFDEGNLDSINKFSRPNSRTLIDYDSQEKALMIVEGVDLSGHVAPISSMPSSFRIAEPPSQSFNHHLLSDFLAQAERSANKLSGHLTGNANKKLRRSRYYGIEDKIDEKSLEEKYSRLLIHRTYDQDWAGIIDLLKERDGIYTIVFMPRSSKNHQKRAETYDDAWDLLQRRQLPEEPLEITGSAATAVENLPEPPSYSGLQSSATPISGFPPSCYTSQSQCEMSTQNCSSHGHCAVRGSSNNPCWHCNCDIPTVRTNSDGTKKTTNWAGAACQKKDISAPFWLIAGFTIALIAVVAMAIGMLFSMGQEDLPSVIGAGVSGPRAKT